MSDVKWIKIVTDIFDNRKIKQIEKMPDADAILVIWFKILCLAGKVNDNGLILLTDDVPYTDEMLACEFDKPISTIRMSLALFEKFSMIEIIDNIYRVGNWEKYQSSEKLNKIREQTRLRVAKYRENLLEKPTSEDVTQNVTQCNATELDKELELELELDKESNKVPYQLIVDAFNQTCVSLPRVEKITDARKRVLKARWKELNSSMDSMIAFFKKVEQSDFLTGRKKEWSAGFDWILKAANFPKIIEGNYDNKEMGDRNGTYREFTGQVNSQNATATRPSRSRKAGDD